MSLWGLIFDSEGRILIAKRNQKKQFGGLWEFPSGKLENGETSSDALIRELQEELKITVKIGRKFDSYNYQDRDLEIMFHPIQCSIEKGQVTPTEHESVKFISLDQLGEYEFAPPDYVAIDMIRTKKQAR